MMVATKDLGEKVGVFDACEAMGVPRSSFYRRQKVTPPVEARPRTSPRALTQDERQMVLDELHSERFIDQAPRPVYAALLGEGRYLCSVRSMYRILESCGEVRERRNQRRHPNYVKPQLIATGPNEVWSWDITKLLGPEKWTYYHLYVILDIFSRYVTGWMVAPREASDLARSLIRESCEKQRVEPDQLTIHSIRGTSMTSKSVAMLLADLGVAKSHSRPHVCEDNPFSEAQLKTLKYRPQFPKRFGSLEDARSFCRSFLSWYNKEHYHSGIGLLTPESVHYEFAQDVVVQRQLVLEEAYRTNPARFVRGKPQPPALPGAVWINPPLLKGGQGGSGGQRPPEIDKLKDLPPVGAAVDAH